MTTSSFLASFLYSLGQITLGLLLHPYQTMQSLVREKAFVWMTVLPTAVLAMVTLLWRFLFVPAVRIVFSCSATNFIGCDYLIFFSNWLTFFCIFWQILLFYLLFRFSKVFKNAN